MKNFVQDGGTITWSNATGSDVTSGDVVVVGNILAIAAVDIADGATGELSTAGVFECPKASAADIAQGSRLVWDVSEGNFDDAAATPATGDLSAGAAIAWAAAGVGATTVLVKIGGSGAVA